MLVQISGLSILDELSHPPYRTYFSLSQLLCFPLISWLQISETSPLWRREEAPKEGSFEKMFEGHQGKEELGTSSSILWLVLGVDDSKE